MINLIKALFKVEEEPTEHHGSWLVKCRCNNCKYIFDVFDIVNPLCSNCEVKAGFTPVQVRGVYRFGECLYHEVKDNDGITRL